MTPFRVGRLPIAPDVREVSLLAGRRRRVVVPQDHEVCRKEVEPQFPILRIFADFRQTADR